MADENDFDPIVANTHRIRNLEAFQAVVEHRLSHLERDHREDSKNINAQLGKLTEKTELAGTRMLESVDNKITGVVASLREEIKSMAADSGGKHKEVKAELKEQTSDIKKEVASMKEKIYIGLGILAALQGFPLLVQLFQFLTRLNH